MTEPVSKIRFLPSGHEASVLPGTTLLEAAAQVNLVLDTPCGGGGVCGKCRVRIDEGALPPRDTERALFSQEELDEGWRLACQAHVAGEGEDIVYIPSTSLFGAQHHILETAASTTPRTLDPSVRKTSVHLSPPTLSDTRSDTERLQEAVAYREVAFAFLPQLSETLRRHSFQGKAVLLRDALIDFQARESSAACHAVALDVGTTTLVASLMDLDNGEEVAVASCMNPQTAFGDDVLSRISHASKGPEECRQLQRVLIDAVNDLLAEIHADAQIEAAQIYELHVAGNTTMQTLFFGVNPQQLGQAPFPPPFHHALRCKTTDLGLNMHPLGEGHSFPIIGGFLGGDTVACMLTTQLAQTNKAALLIDIGTNGEIVLAHEGQLWAASTAAGPAFEGARISQGMRATPGAIDKAVLRDGDLRCNVLGNVHALGLCGSGLIDVCAQLLRTGVIAPNGRLLPPEDLPEDTPKKLQNRLRVRNDHDIAFILSAAEKEEDVLLTQKDVRELQLACAAIRAGILLVLREAKLQPEDLHQVYIAGGFGSFIRRSSARRIGLLPKGIPHERIHYVGNASLGGAQWAALSQSAREEAKVLAEKTQHVELSNAPDFAMEYAMAMAFPDE